ncbi:hypothetical protein L6452_43977 [Arctium lappa]|uniref:Uncharacterized protein n=1 Tax=Arctium lappa TaxID=4217 RepID=A0ACB8XEE1_ARCLA|nr:hypothetical protein L6452_43977 [Arctium lappa]
MSSGNFDVRLFRVLELAAVMCCTLCGATNASFIAKPRMETGLFEHVVVELTLWQIRWREESFPATTKGGDGGVEVEGCCFRYLSMNRSTDLWEGGRRREEVR